MRYLSPLGLGLLFLIALVGLGHAVSPPPIPPFSAHPISSQGNLPYFNWSALPPSQDLTWHDCYTQPDSEDERIYNHDTQASVHGQDPVSSSHKRARKLQCARLRLPLDYNDTHLSSPHIDLPVIRLSSPSSSRRRTLIMGPVGPGQSSIKTFLTVASPSALPWLDELSDEYNILTFEPRGVGYAAPQAGCFGSVWAARSWDGAVNAASGVIQSGDADAEVGTEGPSDLGLRTRLAAVRARGMLCAEKEDVDTRGGDRANLRGHMSTAYVARDMLEILRKTHEEEDRGSKRERHNEQKSFGAKSTPEPSSHSQPKLTYIGFSYGTMVGQTFASLYPQHVDRMVLDGAGSAPDWTSKWQTSSLNDTDAVLSTFYSDCFASSSSCPLWRPEDTGPRDIENRVQEVLDRMKQQAAYTVSDSTTRLISYRDLKIAMYMSTYAPFIGFPSLASVLNDILLGRTNMSLPLPFPFQDNTLSGIPSCSSCSAEDEEALRADYNEDAGTAINCADSEDMSNATFSEFTSYLRVLEGQSTAGAFFQGERKLRCLGWPPSLRPAFRFPGPFGADALEMGILFVGNKLDSVTPMGNAYEMARLFKGSVVLEQRARGHCALANTVPSQCTVDVVRKYLGEGVLPGEGTVCGEECNAFDGSCLGGRQVSRQLERALPIPI